MINEKDLFRLTLYGARYALPVTRAEHEGFENEQVERALQKGDAIVGIFLGRHPTQALHHLGSDVNRDWERRALRLTEAGGEAGNGMPTSTAKGHITL